MDLQQSNIQTNDRYRVWLDQAEHDIEIAKISVTANYYEWACYQSIQSVEKALKSVIVHAGWRPPKVHKLGVLMSMANRANKLFFEVKFDYRKIEAYTFISRYPFVIPKQDLSPHHFVTKKDAETCIQVASQIFFKIKDFIEKGKVQRNGEQDVIEIKDYYFSNEEVENRISEIVNQLQKSDKLDVFKIVLYGGFARDNTRPITSTLDILIVAKTELPFFERINHVHDLTKGGSPIVESLVYTPEEFEKMLNEEGEGYLESAIEEGRVIWERNS